MAQLKHQNCHCCSGSGKELDHYQVGADMQSLRKLAGLKQSYIAMKLGFSTSYICQLEKGERHWNLDLIQAFKKALS